MWWTMDDASFVLCVKYELNLCKIAVKANEVLAETIENWLDSFPQNV